MMNSKRCLSTDQYPDSKRRVPSSNLDADEENDIEIDIEESDMEEIIKLLRNLEKPDCRRAATRAWPKEEYIVEETPARERDKVPKKIT